MSLCRAGRHDLSLPGAKSTNSQCRLCRNTYMRAYSRRGRPTPEPQEPLAPLEYVDVDRLTAWDVDRKGSIKRLRGLVNLNHSLVADERIARRLVGVYDLAEKRRIRNDERTMAGINAQRELAMRLPRLASRLDELASSGSVVPVLDDEQVLDLSSEESELWAGVEAERDAKRAEREALTQRSEPIIAAIEKEAAAIQEALRVQAVATGFRRFDLDRALRRYIRDRQKGATA